jgi:hypothetical protein
MHSRHGRRFGLATECRNRFPASRCGTPPSCRVPQSVNLANCGAQPRLRVRGWNHAFHTPVGQLSLRRVANLAEWPIITGGHNAPLAETA